MNCFLVPKKICDDINSALTAFWWGTDQGKRKIPWVAWKRLALSKREGGLGFRDLSIFNKALLAKQAWRILKNPNSLLARLYKERYHRNSTFLESECGQYVSHGWRSIQAGKDLLKLGIRKQIGAGKSTRIWLDNWLPSSPPRPANGPILHPAMTVDQLWVPNTREWDETKLNQLIPQDAQLAKQLMRSTFTNEDIYIWPYSKDSQYTVKSGYWFASHFDPNADPIEPPHGDLEIKRVVWNLHIPPKLQYFLWRILSHALPTSVELIHRHIHVDPICQRCHLADETINHILFTCPHAQAIWRCSGFANPAILTPDDNIEENIRLLLSTAQDENLCEEVRLLPIWILWNTWKSRNEFLFQKRNVHPDVDVTRSTQEVWDWLEAKHEMNQQRQPTSTPQLSRCPHWEPPPPGWWKCNFDASLNPNHDITGVGWIIRDATGHHIMSGIAKLSPTRSSLQAEANAFLYVLQQVWMHGWRYIWFETDNVELTNLINHGKDHSDIGPLLQDARHWMAKLPLCSLGHINRERNQAADVLSKKAISLSTSSVFFNVPPSYLVNYLYAPFTV